MRAHTVGGLAVVAFALHALGCSRSWLDGGRVAGGGAPGTGGGAGAGGDGAGGGGAGGAEPVCVETHDELWLTLVSGDGAQAWGCEVPGYGGTGEVTLEGAVVAATASQLVLDTCPPGSTCGPGSSYTLEVVSPGASLGVVPAGAYVTLRARVELPWGCSQLVQVRNLPSFFGDPNPVASDDRLYLVGADGRLDTFDDTPLAVETVSVACDWDGTLCGEQGHLALRFVPDGLAPIVLQMGQTAGIDSPPAPLKARNLRSYANSCGGWLDWAWVVWRPE